MRRAAIERLLPGVYQRTAGNAGVLGALLDAMERMHAPTERTLAAVDDLFTPYRSPDRMVAFLLGWVALDHVPHRDARHPDRDPTVALGRLRDLVAAAARIARTRGTAAGLRLAIATATGLDVAISEPAPFHIVVRLPDSAAAHLALVRRLVEAEKPAAVLADVIVGQPALHPEGARP